MCKENSQKHAHTGTSGWDAENHNNWGNYTNPMFWQWLLKEADGLGEASDSNE